MKSLFLKLLFFTCFFAFSHKLFCDDFGFSSISAQQGAMTDDEASAYAAANGIPASQPNNFGMQQGQQSYYQDPGALGMQQGQYPNQQYSNAQPSYQQTQYQQQAPSQYQQQAPLSQMPASSTNSGSGGSFSSDPAAMGGTLGGIGGVGLLAGGGTYLATRKGNQSPQNLTASQGVDASGNPYPLGPGFTPEQMVAQQNVGRQEISRSAQHLGDIIEVLDKKTGIKKLKIKKASAVQLLFMSAEERAEYEHRVAISKETLRIQTIKNAGLTHVSMPHMPSPQQINQQQQIPLRTTTFRHVPQQRSVQHLQPRLQQRIVPSVVGVARGSQLATQIPRRVFPGAHSIGRVAAHR